MFKILEQNGIENENIDGGAFNNFAAGNRDGVLGGVLSECAFAAEGNTVSIGTGVLIIHGIRVKIEATETIALSSFPNTDTRYQIVARINLENKTPSFSLDVRSPSTVIQDELYQSNNGIYEVEIGRFTHSREGRIIELIRTIDTIYGASPSGALSIGDVQAYDLDPGMPPEADVTKRMENGKELLDFSFGIPKAAGSFDPNGNYSGLGAGIFLGKALQSGADINDCIPDTFGKRQMWYSSSINNTFLNLPDEAAKTTFTVEAVKTWELSGNYRIYQELRSVSNNPVKENIFIRCRDSGSSTGTEWTEWEIITTSIGSYPKMGAGYLAKNTQIAASSSSIGWWKVGSIDLAVTGKESVSSSTVIRVTGLYSHVTPSGEIEVNGRLQDGTLNPTACPLYIMSGNLDPSKFCVAFEEKIVSLYVHLGSTYSRYSFTVVQDDIEAKSNSDYFTFNPVYVGSSAPDGAVYAVRQIYASMSEKADKLSDSVGSTSQPIYINSEGVPKACTDVASKNGYYELMGVGSANRLSNNQVGSESVPVYFTMNGVPKACTGIATKTNVNSASMVPYGGQATTLSALASGGVYNITANGFLRIAYQTTAADNFITMKQVDSEGADIWGALANGLKSYGSGYPFIYMPVAAGDHIKVDFSSSVKILQVQLIKVKAV